MASALIVLPSDKSSRLSKPRIELESAASLSGAHLPRDGAVKESASERVPIIPYGDEDYWNRGYEDFISLCW